jgi:hypothetical protein
MLLSVVRRPSRWRNDVTLSSGNGHSERRIRRYRLTPPTNNDADMSRTVAGTRVLRRPNRKQRSFSTTDEQPTRTRIIESTGDVIECLGDCMQLRIIIVDCISSRVGVEQRSSRRRCGSRFVSFDLRRDRSTLVADDSVMIMLMVLSHDDARRRKHIVIIVGRSKQSSECPIFS